MRKERLLVHGIHARLGVVEALPGVAILACYRTIALRRIRQLLNHLGRGKVRAAAFIPLDIERRRAALGGPCMVADHGHAVVDADHLTHAGNLLRVGVVDGGERAAEHRAIHDGGVHHAGHADIEAEHCRAVYFSGRVETLGGRAD